MLEVHSCSAEERRYVVAGNPTHVVLRWRQKERKKGGGGGIRGFPDNGAQYSSVLSKDLTRFSPVPLASPPEPSPFR